MYICNLFENIIDDSLLEDEFLLMFPELCNKILLYSDANYLSDPFYIGTPKIVDYLKTISDDLSLIDDTVFNIMIFRLHFLEDLKMEINKK